MSRAQFMKDAKEGMILECKYSYCHTREEKAYKFVPRKITKVQTNAVYLEWPKDKSLYNSKEYYNFWTRQQPNGSYLEIPRASRMEYDGKTLKIYGIGERNLTEKEKEVFNVANTMSEFNKGEYLIRNRMTYLIPFHEVKGKEYCPDTGKIRDESVKGNLELEYVVIK